MLKYNPHFVELLISMTEKELRTRYKYTVFGFLWLVANPIIQMIVIGYIFRFFMKAPIDNYYHYLFISLLVWNFFSLSLSRVTPSIVSERSLIKKAQFSHFIIPLSIILSNFIHFAVAILLFSIPVYFLGTATVYTVPIMIIAISLLTVFTIGLGLLLSACNVRYRDVNFLTQAVLILWFYATPIIYTLNQMPMDKRWLWNFNPLAGILQLMQVALFGHNTIDPSLLTMNVLLIFILFIIGIRVFFIESKTFDDWI